MQPGGQDMSSSYSPVKDTGVSLPVPTNSSFNYTGYSQPETCSPSDIFSKFKSPHHPPSHLAHTTSSNSEPIQPGHQPSTFTDSSRNSVSNTDATAVVTPEQPALIEDDAGKIAFRTWSKLQLTDTSGTEIESAFVAPDITTDMYDNYDDDDDADYAQFLSSLNSATDDAMIEDDADANDPEFNCMSKPHLAPYRVSCFDKSANHRKKIIELREELISLSEGEDVPYQVAAITSTIIDMWKMQIDGHMSSSYSPVKATRVSLPVSTTSTSVTYTRDSQPEPSPSSTPFLNFETRHPTPPPQLAAHITSSNSEPIELSHQPSTITNSSTNSVSDSDSVVAPLQHALIEDNMREHIQLLLQNVLFQVQEVTQAQSMINTLSACKVQTESYTNLLQPAFIGHPSQQQVSGMSGLSAKTPHERTDHVQQAAPSQIQPLVSIPAGSLPVTFLTAPAVQLPAGLPPIAGIFYIQFSAPTAAGPSTSSAVLEPTSRGSHKRKKTKRKITKPSITSRLKKRKVQAPVIDEAAVSDTQGRQNTSPDLLAKTMFCSIEEYTTCPSPQTQCQYSQHIDQLGMSFTSSTPIAQDKHPSPRNLNWEFDATHRQSFHNIPAPQTQNATETCSSQSKSSWSQVSACQTVVSQNETTATAEPRSHVMSPLHCSEPDVNGEPRKEEESQ